METSNRNGSDFSPGLPQAQLEPLEDHNQGQSEETRGSTRGGKKHGFAARFTRSSSSASTSSRSGAISAMFGRKSHHHHYQAKSEEVEVQPLVQLEQAGKCNKEKVEVGEGQQERLTPPPPMASSSTGGGTAAEESTDSEHDPIQGTSGFRRKISTNKEITNTVSYQLLFFLGSSII